MGCPRTDVFCIVMLTDLSNRLGARKFPEDKVADKDRHS